MFKKSSTTRGMSTMTTSSSSKRVRSRWSKVFSADYDFVIPDYQRPYAWGTEQALQLLDDLDGALDRDNATSPTSWARSSW